VRGEVVEADATMDPTEFDRHLGDISSVHSTPDDFRDLPLGLADAGAQSVLGSVPNPAPID
jgi:hypothetical protein